MITIGLILIYIGICMLVSPITFIVGYIVIRAIIKRR